jgi:hypothetical protein
VRVSIGLLVCVVSSCGGDAVGRTSSGSNLDGSAQNGGATSTGGAGNGGATSSGGRSPGGASSTPPAHGAVAEFIQPTAGGNGCQASAAEFTAPPNADPVSGTHASLYCDLSAGTGCAPTSNEVVDGNQDASVTCTVTGSGPFNVSASIAQGDVVFSVSGTMTATGGKAFVSSSHAQQHLQDAQCDITIEPNQGQIKSGAVWAAFNCQNFGDISTGSTGCTATGKFIFENCGK